MKSYLLVLMLCLSATMAWANYDHDDECRVCDCASPKEIAEAVAKKVKCPDCNPTFVCDPALKDCKRIKCKTVTVIDPTGRWEKTTCVARKCTTITVRPAP